MELSELEQELNAASDLIIANLTKAISNKSRAFKVASSKLQNLPLEESLRQRTLTETAIETLDWFANVITKRTAKNAGDSRAGWQIVRDVAITIQNKVRTLRIAKRRLREQVNGKPNEKLASKLASIDRAIEIGEWTAEQITSLKKETGYDAAMMNRVAVKASKQNQAEPFDLTEEQIYEEAARQRAKRKFVPEEDRQSQYEIPTIRIR